ncbi:MAG: tRNA preQ1(34) S-adenosylmethionine ribosyltransferase-isomerase QueA [Leptospiraceae bacterium]|nr:tRNA preQ1(34) S-adenosylmethionine ribosyltransferase-isomerase QueA [Leptospiraceae bacterium]
MPRLSDIEQEYGFPLPDRLIARYPAQFRDKSRLLALPAGADLPEHRQFFELPELLEPSDILVWNDTMVEPRRVRLERKTGAKMEALFLEPESISGEPNSAEHGPHSIARTRSNEAWSCLIRNAKARSGEFLIHSPSGVEFRFIRKKTTSESGSNEDFYLIAPDGLNMHNFFLEHGEMPIPPYLGREEEGLDRLRYQTVYAAAKSRGSLEYSSAAAPTAGLHFTAELIEKLKNKGIRICSVQLAVGLGTFSPLQEENLRRKELHRERFALPEETAELLNRKDGRVIAIGTTTLRALESNIRQFGKFQSGHFETSAFYHPPDTIQSIQGLITNFHLPGSSLLLLVAAFAGKQRILEAYRTAIEKEYRFYSYGDAMLVFA